MTSAPAPPSSLSPSPPPLRISSPALPFSTSLSAPVDAMSSPAVPLNICLPPSLTMRSLTAGGAHECCGRIDSRGHDFDLGRIQDERPGRGLLAPRRPEQKPAPNDTQSEVDAAIRSAGIGRIEDVGAVVLETDGRPKAPPMTTPNAKSTIFPLTANFLNSSNMGRSSRSYSGDHTLAATKAACGATG